MKALAGIRILDLTHMVSGPYGTLLLADSGAEVIKVEPPKVGEATRKLLAREPRYSIKGMGAYFLTLGRNKKSISLDIKTAEGRSIFHQLVKQADAVIYNYRPGVAQRRGLHYDQLKSVNPRIITCSITGFGEVGPNKDLTAFDLVAQGAGGSMYITKGDQPQRAGVPIGDLGGGLMAAYGLCTALLARHQTGRGQHLDISMQDCQVSLLNYMATIYGLAQEEPPPIGNGHFAFVPYGTFGAKDGHIILAIVTDEAWSELVELLQLPELRAVELKDHQGRVQHREQIEKCLAEILPEKTKDEWIKIFSQAGIPCGPVHRIRDVMNDPHLRARQMVVEVSHPEGGQCEQVGHPIKMSETHEETFQPPPLLGQHNEEVLAGLLGLSTEQLQDLSDRGIT